MTTQTPLYALSNPDKKVRVAHAVADLMEYACLTGDDDDIDTLERTFLELNLLGRCRTCQENIRIDALDQPCPNCEHLPREEPA